MPLPGDLNTITVTGTYLNGAGSPLTGYVTLTPSTDLQDSTGHVVLRAAPLYGYLSSGVLNITVPCTDNTTIAPSTWAYNVAEVLSDGPQSLTTRSYTIELPHTLGATVDITNVAPVNPPVPYSPYYGVLAAPNMWTAANVFTGEVTVPTPTNPTDPATKAYVDAHAGVASVNGHTGTVVLSSTDVGAVPEATVTTKGDLLAASSSTTVTRLAVGSDGQILQADSTQTTGLKWAPAPSSGVTSVNGHTGVVVLAAADVGAVPTTAEGAANGVATLDGTAHLTAGQLPTSAVTTATTAAGDLSGTYAGPTVAKINGVSVTGTPAAGAFPVATTPTAAAWTIVPRDQYAAKLGLVAEPFPVETINDVGLGLTAGFLILALVRPGPATINNLGLWLGGAGSGSSGVNSMALFSEAGTQLAVTGDMTAALSNSGNNNTYVEAAVGTPYTTADATSYYVGVLCQMSSNPTIGGTFSGSGLHIPTIKGHRAGIVVGGQSSMPASIDVSGATSAAAGYWLVAS